MEAARGRGTERLVLAIGEISVSHRTVLTPAGSAPVNAVAWTIRGDPSPAGRGWRRALHGGGTPGLVTIGVTVTGPGWQHTETVGPAGPEVAATVRAKVTQARMLALRSVVWSLPEVQVRDDRAGKVIEPAR